MIQGPAQLLIEPRAFRLTSLKLNIFITKMGLIL